MALFKLNKTEESLQYEITKLANDCHSLVNRITELRKRQHIKALGGASVSDDVEPEALCAIDASLNAVRVAEDRLKEAFPLLLKSVIGSQQISFASTDHLVGLRLIPSIDEGLVYFNAMQLKHGSKIINLQPAEVDDVVGHPSTPFVIRDAYFVESGTDGVHYKSVFDFGRQHDETASLDLVLEIDYSGMTTTSLTTIKVSEMYS